MDHARPSPWRLTSGEWISAALLGGRYMILFVVCVSLTRFEGGVAFLWVATAILFADLVDRPFHCWPVRIGVCFLAGALASGVFGLGWRAAFPLAAINTSEAAAGALLMRRLVPRSDSLQSFRSIGAFLLVTGLLVPAVSAFAGAATVHLVAKVPYWSNWLHWYTGHALGTITFAPMLMLAASGDVARWLRESGRPERIHAAAALCGVALTSIGVFAQSVCPLLFLPLLPMMIAVFALGRIGAAASVLLLTLIGAAFTLSGHGPISLLAGGLGLRLQFLQFYLAIAVMTALPAAGELRQRKRLIDQLQESDAIYRLITDRTGDIIMTLEADGTIRYVSPSIRAIVGVDPAELVGKRSHAFIWHEDLPRVVETHRRALAAPDDTFTVDYRSVMGTGEPRWFETHTRATVDENGTVTGVVSAIRHISERKSRELALSRAAEVDPLTGVANRRVFDAALSRLCEAPNEVAGCIAMLDLDRFKRINDRHGHAAGDIVLRAFAELLQESVRASDTVARLGGEEFAIILAGVGIEPARAICDRIRARFAALSFKDAVGITLSATVSIGLAEITSAQLDPLRAADEALYRAKTEGRNRIRLAA